MQLREVELVKGLEMISGGAFSRCSSLEQSKVPSIDNYVDLYALKHF